MWKSWATLGSWSKPVCQRATWLSLLLSYAKASPAARHWNSASRNLNGKSLQWPALTDFSSASNTWRPMPGSRTLHVSRSLGKETPASSPPILLGTIISWQLEIKSFAKLQIQNQWLKEIVGLLLGVLRSQLIWSSLAKAPVQTDSWTRLGNIMTLGNYTHCLLWLVSLSLSLQATTGSQFRVQDTYPRRGSLELAMKCYGI